LGFVFVRFLSWTFDVWKKLIIKICFPIFKPSSEYRWLWETFLNLKILVYFWAKLIFWWSLQTCS
jgi:hypothetical protein